MQDDFKKPVKYINLRRKKEPIPLFLNYFLEPAICNKNLNIAINWQ
jgi:hypothetical protein